MSTPETVAVTAQVRIAPTAIKIRLTEIPMCCSFPYSVVGHRVLPHPISRIEGVMSRSSQM
jgi:hypothetical protein